MWANLGYCGEVQHDPAVIHRRVRTGPLPMLPHDDLDPPRGLEQYLPRLFVAGLLLLLVIQLVHV